MEIVTYEEAIEQGLPKYYTGEPCREGHDSERYTANKQCCVCSRLSAAKSRAKKTKEEHNEYARKWRAENPGLS